MNDICIAWTVAMVKVSRIPWTTHCNLLPRGAFVMDDELCFFEKMYKID